MASPSVDQVFNGMCESLDVQAALVEDVKRLQAENESLKTDVKDLCSVAEEAEDQHTKLEAELAKTKELSACKFDELKIAHEQLEAQHALTMEAESSARHVHEEEQAKSIALTTQSEELQIECERLGSLLETAQCDLQEKDAELDRIKASLADAECAGNIARSSAAEAHEKHLAEQQEKQSELDRLKSLLEESEEAERKANANATEAKEQLALKVQKEISRQREHHDDERQCWERQVQAMQEAFDQQLAACRQERVDLEVPLTGILEEKEELRRRVESLELDLRAKDLDETEQQARGLALQARVLEEERVRRDARNAIQDLKGNVRVIGRLRKGVTDGACEAVRVSEGTGKISLLVEGALHNYEFDNFFGGDSTQQRVYGEVEGLVQSSLDGYKVCIFAYGQTGSGKTFTMNGSSGADTEGIIPRALTHIFQSTEELKAKGWTWTIEVSFLEVYKEKIRDLLLEGTAAAKQPVHEIRKDPVRGNTVKTLTVAEVKSKEQIEDLMEKAHKQRSVQETDLNATSSRSHAVITIYLEGKNSGLNEKITGALHLVDLAGTERVADSNVKGERLTESCKINKSLSAFSNVFLAKRMKYNHIPFRDSVLTRLMEPCLSGSGKALMVVTVRPEDAHAKESLGALDFAAGVALCNTGGKPEKSVSPLTETASRATSPRNHAGSG